MAVELEMLNLIVPIKKIEKKYPGGWGQCSADFEDSLGVWYDEHLFRQRAMNAMDMHFLLEHWKSMGFKTHRGGKDPRWLDVCIIEHFSDEPTLPCSWIKIEDGCAYLKGQPKGEVMGTPVFIR